MHLTQVFKYYREPHQIAAINMLEEALPAELLERHADWITCFFSEPAAKEPLIMVKKP